MGPESAIALARSHARRAHARADGRSGPALMEPVLQKYPNLTFIVDHFAWAVPGEAREAKVKAMESLARFRNVHVKVSSLPLVSGSAPPEYEDLHPLIRRVHAAYGG